MLTEKEVKAAKAREWRAKNKDKVAANNRKWREANREWRRAYDNKRSAERRAERERKRQERETALAAKHKKPAIRIPGCIQDRIVTEEERQANRGLPSCYLGKMRDAPYCDQGAPPIYGQPTAQVSVKKGIRRADQDSWLSAQCG